MPTLELISYQTCPFVQRTMIVLLEKKITCKTTYIDLTAKPAWFLQISPLGKVPVLRVDTQTLFESLVINEYLDESYIPSLQPSEPLSRAINRAWMAFSSELLMSIVKLTRVETEAEFTAQKQDCQKKLALLEQQLVDQPFFNGQQFSLIDAAYAPCFSRLTGIEAFFPLGLTDATPKVADWSKNLLNRESVKNSVASNFYDLLKETTKVRNGFLGKQLG